MPTKYVNETDPTHNLEIRNSFFIEPTVTGTDYVFHLTNYRSFKEQDLNDEENEESEESEDGSDDAEPDLNEEEQSDINSVRASVFPKIIFLGTGSSFPAATKNVTSLLVHTA